MTRSTKALTLLAFPALLAACGKSESSGARDSAAAAATPAATPAARDSAGAQSAAASGGLTDANIVYILDQANASDSARGRLAETKGTNGEVKSFGKLMVGEHHALRAAGQQLAKKLGVTPQAPSGDQSEAQAKQELDSLNSQAKGKAWDKAYADYEVTYHQGLKETATKALGAAKNEELKALIKRAAPVVQRHLDHALALQKKLGS